MQKEYSIDKLIENAESCVNMLDLCHKMGIKNVGGEDYREVRNLARELGIVLRFSYKKEFCKQKQEKIPIGEILIEKSSYKNSARLKKRLISEGLKEEKCENCGLTEWMGQKISLQIHHINGVHDDNRVENLQILCPNCHSLTDTYAGKNTIGKRLKKENKVPSFEETHPSKGQLEEDFKTLGSFVKIGKKYGVSGNAVKKWFLRYGFPKGKKNLEDYLR